MKQKDLDKNKTLEDLKLFKFSINNWLEELIDISFNQGFSLNFSLESTIDLAKFIRKNNIINSKENINSFSNCWIYLGEVFRKHAINSYWTIGLEDKKI